MTQSAKITITKGLYDYVGDKLDVNATTTLSLGTSKLYCNGYAMVWDSGLKAWKMPANVFFAAPQLITVCAPGAGLIPQVLASSAKRFTLLSRTISRS